MTAVGKQRIVRRALIPDSLTWEIYDKPSKPHKTTEEGGESGGNGGTTTGGNTGGSTGGNTGNSGNNGGGNGDEPETE